MFAKSVIKMMAIIGIRTTLANILVILNMDIMFHVLMMVFNVDIINDYIILSFQRSKSIRKKLLNFHFIF